MTLMAHNGRAGQDAQHLKKPCPPLELFAVLKRVLGERHCV
jgi:hypothetical protein